MDGFVVHYNWSAVDNAVLELDAKSLNQPLCAYFEGINIVKEKDNDADGACDLGPYSGGNRKLAMTKLWMILGMHFKMGSSTMIFLPLSQSVSKANVAIVLDLRYRPTFLYKKLAQ
ncbi:hypothetical protein SUGI_0534750 [Cryptomeria japonica]|nr:hypothetical protein SUGI_0534750 [Cryptomeria japonica]